MANAILAQDSSPRCLLGRVQREPPADTEASLCCMQEEQEEEEPLPCEDSLRGTVCIPEENLGPDRRLSQSSSRSC